MNLSNENRLLLLFAQTKIPENKLDQVKYLVSLPLNWNKILESAFSQGIAPLLYNNLKGIQEKQYIPQEVMDKFKKTYHENIARNMYLYAELLRILKAFNDKGIKVIVLKGAALAKIVYGDIGLRSMIDIDLLVKQGDLSYAKGIMSDLNYVAETHILSEEWYRENHYHLPTYINREKSLMVEIHWHITGGSFGINIKKWFERGKYTKIDECQVLIPSPEDMIIHLCLHLYNHGYYSKMILRELCDISETLNHYKEEINWILFQDEINEYGLHKPVYSTLYLLKKFYGNIEKSLQIQWFKPSHINLKLIKILERRMFIENDISSSIPGGLVKSLAVNTFWRKVKLLLPIIFPPREVMSKRYSVPCFLIYFYYLIRPFRLLVKYGKHLLTIYQIKIIRND